MKGLIPWKKEQRNNAAPALWDDSWFDRMWEDPFGNLFSSLPTFSSLVPLIDVSEDKMEVTIRAETPGLTEKDIQLTWHDGVLRIKGEKRDEKKEKKGRYCECRYGYFSREIPLGDSVDWSGAKARYKNGVLTVKVPRRENAPKAMKVKIN